MSARERIQKSLSFRYRNASPVVTEDAQRKQKERERKRRQEFIAKRSAKREEFETSAEEIDDIRERFSRRRCGWVFLRFEDDAVEAEYEEFSFEKNLRSYQLHRVGIAVLILFSFIVALSFAPDPAAPSTWLLCVSLLSGGATVAMSLLASPTNWRWLTRVEYATTPMLGIIPLAVALFLLPPGSTLGSDVTWVGNLAIMIAVSSAAQFGAVVSSSLMTLLAAAIVASLALNSIWLVPDTMFVTVGCSTTFLAVLTNEKLLRQEFLERRVAKYFADATAQEVAAQQTLVENIVPPHVIPPLMAWLGTDLDPSRAYVQVLDRVMVMFLKFDELDASATRSFWLTMKSTLGGSHPGGGMQQITTTRSPPTSHSGAGVVAHKTTMDCGVKEDDACLIMPFTPHGQEEKKTSSPLEEGQQRSSAFACVMTKDDMPSSSLLGVSLEQQQQQQRPSSAIMGDNNNSSDHPILNLLEQHNRADRLLGKYSGTLTKIKTVGDLLLVAGPFGTNTSNGGSPSSSSLQQCVHDAVLFSAEVRREDGASTTSNNTSFSRLPFRCGIHVGPIVGTVMGASRLSFDIFGSTVNTASRVMSTIAQGDEGFSANGGAHHRATVVLSEAAVEVATMTLLRGPDTMNIEHQGPILKDEDEIHFQAASRGVLVVNSAEDDGCGCGVSQHVTLSGVKLREAKGVGTMRVRSVIDVVVLPLLQ